MGCCYCFFGTLLVIINIIYMIIGLALLILGILLRVGQSLVESYLRPIIESELQKMGITSLDLKNVMNYLFSNLTSIAVALIVIGIILFVLSIVGMCSVCCKSQCTIIVYITILAVILAVQVVAIIVFVAKPDLVKECITTVLKSIIEKYVGFTETNIESFIINIMGITLNCCGANNFNDFAAAPNFKKQLTGSFTYNGNSRGPYDGVTLQYPICCCQFANNDFVNADECIKNGNANNKDVGCTNVLYNKAQTYIDIVYKIIGGIIGFQALLLLAAIICLVSLKQDGSVKGV